MLSKLITGAAAVVIIIPLIAIGILVTALLSLTLTQADLNLYQDYLNARDELDAA